MSDTVANKNQYIAAFIVSLCALYVANIPLSDMRSLAATGTVCLMGFTLSYLWRIKGWNFHYIETPVLILLMVLSVIAVASAGVPFLLSSLYFQGDRSIALAQLLAWMIAIRSFSLGTDTTLLFCCIPPLAMFGLVATIATDFNALPIFLIFIFSAVYLIIGDLGTIGLGKERKGKKTNSLFLQASIATLCIVPALIASFALGEPLQNLTMNYIRISGIASRTHRSYQMFHPHLIRFNENPELPVGIGPVSQSDTLVMSVTAPDAYYMRGSTFDNYTGTSWRDTLPLNKPLQNGGQWNAEFGNYKIPVTNISQTSMHSTLVRQDIKVFNSDISDIYAAPEIRRLVMMQQAVRTNGAGTVQLDHYLYNMQYTVYSSIPPISRHILRNVKGKYPHSIQSLYLQLPYDKNSSDFSQLKNLCHKILRGKTNNYDRIIALKDWISSHCYYSTKADATPAGKDATSYFLFDYHVGYCDRFATSLAVLSRIAGIPSRVAIGFAPGEKTGSEYLIREKDSHAWTEVFFPKIGWITFDATDGARDINTRKKPIGILAYLKSIFSGEHQISMILASVALVFIVFVVYRETKRTKLQSISTRNEETISENNRKIIMYYTFACRAMAKKGLSRPSDMTPLEFLHEATYFIPGNNAVILGFSELTHLCNQAQYSQQTMSSQNVETAATALEMLKINLKSINRESRQIPAEGINS